MSPPIPFSFWKTSSAVFDPTTLALSGYWRASYAGSPWNGTATAGASSGRNFSEATNPPATGSAVNGFTPADFDGTNDRLRDTTHVLSDFIAATTWSAWALFWADAAFADAGAGNRWRHPAFFADSGGFMGIVHSSAGFGAFAYGAGTAELNVAAATGGWHLGQAKSTGGNILVRVDGGSWSSQATGGGVSTLTGTVAMGSRYDGTTAFFDGRVLEVGVANTAFADATFDNIKSYVNSRYGLSL